MVICASVSQSKRLKTNENEYVETDAYSQFENEATEIRKMVQSQNRKKKAAGGFQSMGKKLKINLSV